MEICIGKGVVLSTGMDLRTGVSPSSEERLRAGTAQPGVEMNQGRTYSCV